MNVPLYLYLAFVAAWWILVAWLVIRFFMEEQENCTLCPDLNSTRPADKTYELKPYERSGSAGPNV